MNATCMKLLAAASLLAGTAASATMLTYAGTVTAAPPGSFGLNAPRLLDQSGLSAGYVSGVTAFAGYAASGVSHVGSSTSNGTGYLAAAGATVDIDLGQTLLLGSLALWNDNDAQGVRSFSLQIADNAAYAGAVSLGSFTAQYGNANSFLTYSKGTAAQVFDLSDAAGRYVRIQFENAYSGASINVGELVFGGQAQGAVPPAATVPAPDTLALAGMGLLALAVLRRREPEQTLPK